MKWLRRLGWNTAASKERRLSIGAIMHNEGRYLMEWIAYHKLQGVEHCYVGDNDSRDGTTALLEGLQAIGVVTRIFQMRMKQGNSQLIVYEEIRRRCADGRHLVAFIDADEFLLASESAVPAAVELRSLLAPPDCAALAVNWRLFGSSGRVDAGEGLVIERFLDCSHRDAHANRRFKSVVKPEAIKAMRVHRGTPLPGKRYADTVGHSHLARRYLGELDEIPVCEGRLRLYHYRIKPLSEFTAGKAVHGSAARSGTARRGMGFFKSNDFNDERCELILAWLEPLRQSIAQLEAGLRVKTNHSVVVLQASFSFAGGRLSGMLLCDRPLPDPRICVTTYDAPDEGAREHLIQLHDDRRFASMDDWRYHCDAPLADPGGDRNQLRVRLVAHPAWFSEAVL